MNHTLDKLSLGDKLGVNFEQNETIKWVGKPDLRSHFLNEIRETIIGLLLMIGGILFFELIAYVFKTTISWDDMLLFYGIISVIFIYRSSKTFLKLRATTYVVTDLSIIIHSNFNTSSTKTIHRKDIQTKELKRSFIDKHFNTGTISIYTGTTKVEEGKLEKEYDYLSSIKEPEFIYSLL
jgi:uncharacterized membrane protein YdbT with pleckstrin-like domain